MFCRRLIVVSPQVSALFALLALTALPVIAQPQQTDPLPDAPTAKIPAPTRQLPLAPATSSSSQPAALIGTTPITILEDTPISVITNASISSKHATGGMALLFTVSDDVLVDNVLAIPRGATIHGEVVKTKKSGVLTGSPELTLKLISLDLGGHTYPLYTSLFQVKGLSKTKPTQVKAVRGAYAGAIAGAFVSGVSSKGGVTPDASSRAVTMTAGAAAGAGVGTAISAASPGPELRIPAEAQVEFYLASPITIAPVSRKEAARLGQGLHSGGPSLYVRGETP